MRVTWYIEGAGCPFQQCGLSKGRVVEIDDNDLPIDPVARSNAIDAVVQDEFDRHVYPVWDEK